jgi:hypothetical protein
MKKVVLILFVTSMMFSTQLFSQKAVAEEITGSTIQQNDDFYLKNQLKTFFVSVIELSNIKDGSTMSINITGFDNPYNQKVLGDKYTMIQKLSLSENTDVNKILSLLASSGFKLNTTSSASIDGFVSTRFLFSIDALK